ncbi:glycosyltransferase family 4 protein [Pontibacter locisalis]|uniref:Glycosyltransferase family 4 protein n=1 Tax=Pontibacter locisalis TaxID=1719035 RepID=A0ABW5ILK4_9BACT
MKEVTVQKKLVVYVVPAIAYEGISKQVLLQIDALIERGYTVKLIALTTVNDNVIFELAPKLDQENVIQLEQPDAYLSVKALKGSPSVALQISKLLKEWKPAVVFAHTPYAHFVMRLVKLLSFSEEDKIKLWQYFHITQYAEFPLTTWRRKLINVVNRHLAKRFDDGHIFVSKAAKEDVQQNLVSLKNYRVIFNAIPFIEAEQHVDSLEKPHSQSTLPYTIVIPGRIEEVKGQLWFLGVFKEFLRRNSLKPSEIKLILAGGGSLCEEATREIKILNIEDYVSVTGYISNIAIKRFIYDADLVAVPSLREGFGLVVLEALICGRIVLCSDAGGLKEIVEDGITGFTFKTSDDDDCLKQINLIYHQRGKAILDKEEIARLLHGKFSFEKHMQEVVSLIDNT